MTLRNKSKHMPEEQNPEKNIFSPDLSVEPTEDIHQETSEFGKNSTEQNEAHQEIIEGSDTIENQPNAQGNNEFTDEEGQLLVHSGEDESEVIVPEQSVDVQNQNFLSEEEKRQRLRDMITEGVKLDAASEEMEHILNESQ